MQSELTCERCAVPLRMEDVDAARDAGICPRCGDLVRGTAVREVGYRSLARVAPHEDAAAAPDSFVATPPPPSSRDHRAPSRSLSWWSELPQLDGSICLRVTSDSHALMPKLFAGLLFMLFGTGFVATLLGTREAQPAPFLVLLGVGCAVGGGVTLGRGLWRMGQSATFAFKKSELLYTAGAVSRSLATKEVLRFRPRMTDVAAATTRTTERIYTVEIVTTTQVVVVPVALTGEERVHALTARLDSMLKTAQAAELAAPPS